MAQGISKTTEDKKQEFLTPLLHLQNLKIAFETEQGFKTVMNNAEVKIFPQQRVGFLGESGSGKSVSALSILKLLPHPSAQVSGRFFWRGEDMESLATNDFRQLFRWKKIAFVFQEMGAALNPVMTIGQQFDEILTPEQKKNKEVENLLQECGFADPKSVLTAYPHTLSGGMQQRILLALALVHNPELIITDEPTSALDSSLQQRMMQLIENRVAKNKMAWLVISHDLGLVGKYCDFIYVFYAGKIVEEAPAQELLFHPHHPYSLGLLKSAVTLYTEKKQHLYSIPFPTEKKQPLPGCVFADRCSYSQKICFTLSPQYNSIGSNRKCACHFPILESLAK